MNDAAASAVVVDTMVIGWLFDDHLNPRADRYRAVIADSPVLLSFQTVMELRYGALHARGGQLRRRQLDRRVAGLTVVQPDDAMITLCAELREGCRRTGHPLGSKVHDGDRWIASTAIRLGLPLVSDDGVFDSAPGLQLLTARPRS